MAKQRNHLLVIDWDYFFPNPWDGADYDTVVGGKESLWLYDWGHAETPMFVYHLWTTRAAGFVRHNLPLPHVTDDWRTFAQRFNIADSAQVFVADSNAFAGMLGDNYDDPGTKPYASVWLYDAHHDCGYGIKSYAEWRKKLVEKEGNFECGDWMLLHQMRGAKLNYRRPPWQKEMVSQINPGVRVDVQQDDGSTPPVVFSDVFICRSGAWTPPWDDPKFVEFINSFGREPTVMDNPDIRAKYDDADFIRPFDMEDVKRELEARAEADRLLREYAKSQGIEVDV